jgi:antagonist of KipI
MDTTSLRIANLLVRNATDTQALEIALVGPTLEIVSDCTLALAGADFGATLNGELVGNWRAFHAQAGATLKFGSPQSGARAYLAAANGLSFEREGAESAVSPLRLAKGDLLRNTGEIASGDKPLMHLPVADRPTFDEPAVLRILPGPHWDRFTPEAQAALTSEEFEVSHESNRIGIRLKGAPLEYKPGATADIISEPTPLGSIQIPSSGQPIILMADRPTTGGYSKIATVISADIARAGQLAPSSHVRFVISRVEDDQAAARAVEARLHLLEQMATWPR